MDKIKSARDLADDGRAYIRKEIHKRLLKGQRVDVKNIDDPTGQPVVARINAGRWISDCECNGAEFVDPGAPVFFCWSCLNSANGQKARPVIFPANVEEIEATLLERPVNTAGVPVIGVEIGGNVLKLGRDWEPHETVEDLHIQQDEAIDAYKKRGRQ